MENLKHTLIKIITEQDDPSLKQKIVYIKAICHKIIAKIFAKRIKKRIVGKDNQVTWGTSTLESIDFDINGNNNKILIEDDCTLKNVKFYIRGNNHTIKIGKGCKFNQGSSLWFEDCNGSLEIGEQTTFETVHIAVTEPNSKVSIGSDCMFACDIDIRTGDSHSIVDSTTKLRVNPAKDIVIGDHVWVAAHCIILKGVCIPSNCVVATGSVVVKGCDEEGSIFAGNPAKIVKRGTTWLRDRIYDAHKS